MGSDRGDPMGQLEDLNKYLLASWVARAVGALNHAGVDAVEPTLEGILEGIADLREELARLREDAKQSRDGLRELLEAQRGDPDSKEAFEWLLRGDYPEAFVSSLVRELARLDRTLTGYGVPRASVHRDLGIHARFDLLVRSLVSAAVASKVRVEARKAARSK